MEKNRLGLVRRIPENVRRTIRQKSGFGCVICGRAVCHYEHVDPEFADAKEHVAACMTYLCGHCHDKVTRGILSKETVKKAMANPKCLQNGFSFDAFDVGNRHPSFRLANCICHNTFTVVRIRGTDILGFAPPEEEGGPFRLSALIADSTGKRILTIDNNDWYAESFNWDVEVSGKVLTVRRAPGDVAFRIVNHPHEFLEFTHLDMFYGGYHLKGTPSSGFCFINSAGGGGKFFEGEFNSINCILDLN